MKLLCYQYTESHCADKTVSHGIDLVYFKYYGFGTGMVDLLGLGQIKRYSAHGITNVFLVCKFLSFERKYKDIYLF